MTIDFEKHLLADALERGRSETGYCFYCEQHDHSADCLVKHILETPAR